MAVMMSVMVQAVGCLRWRQNAIIGEMDVRACTFHNRIMKIKSRRKRLLGRR
ncbi:unnamed protein product [Ectocarpus sp. 6 AP-2014]